jgi:hypothetical protein
VPVGLFIKIGLAFLPERPMFLMVGGMCGQRFPAGRPAALPPPARKALCDMKATWSVAVIYEDAESQETAMTFCDCLVQRFWTQFGFDVSWWPFDLLSDRGPALDAASRAARADLIVFAAKPTSDIPAHLKAWAEGWLRERQDREGTLVCLAAGGEDASSPSAATEIYLRHLAHRAGLDFLTEVPHNISFSIPESPESYVQRAQQVTSVLDGILRQPPPPPRLLA